MFEKVNPSHPDKLCDRIAGAIVDMAYEDGKLVINPEEAEVVKRIFREYLEGRSYYDIGNGLTADGIKTAAGSDYWLASTLRKILRKPNIFDLRPAGRSNESLNKKILAFLAPNDYNYIYMPNPWFLRPWVKACKYLRKG